MSMEGARSYYLRLATDDDFLQRVSAATSIEERLQIAEVAGYQVSLDELHQALIDLVEAKTLDDAFGGDSGEVLAYAALSLLDIQQRTAIPYGPPLFWTQPFRPANPPTGFRR